MIKITLCKDKYIIFLKLFKQVFSSFSSMDFNIKFFFLALFLFFSKAANNGLSLISSFEYNLINPPSRLFFGFFCWRLSSETSVFFIISKITSRLVTELYLSLILFSSDFISFNSISFGLFIKILSLNSS